MSLEITNKDLVQKQYWQELLDKASKWEIESKLLAQEAKPKELDYSLSNIPNIEKEVYRCEKLGKIVKEERLGITRNFDASTKRLMEAEKIYEGYAEEIKKKLLPLKFEKKKLDDEAEKKARDLIAFSQTCELDYNAQVAKANLFLQEKISEIYQSCLLDESELDVNEYLEAALEVLSEEQFQCTSPLISESDERYKLAEKVYTKWDAEYFVNLFKTELVKAFDSFEDDRKRKVEALESRKAVEEAAAKEVIFEKNTNDSFLPTYYRPVEEKTKSLKVVWKLEETNVFSVLKAFAQVENKASTYYKGKNYFDIVEPIVKVIENMKNAGVEFKDLIFKEDHKL